jgi:hypothetical protein
VAGTNSPFFTVHTHAELPVGLSILGVIHQLAILLHTILQVLIDICVVQATVDALDSVQCLHKFKRSFTFNWRPVILLVAFSYSSATL